jgi:hypothetical protein
MSKIFSKKNKETPSEHTMPQTENLDELEVSAKENSNLDINLVISSFQDKLTQVMTELVIKEATIKQLLLQIEKLKGR